MKIDKKRQFKVSSDRIATILSNYNLELLSCKEASSGIENTTIITKTSSGKFVVRIYRQAKKSIDSIKLEIDFLQYLGKNSVLVPSIIKNNNGEYLTEVEADGFIWQIIVMDFADGVHVAEYSAQLAKHLAKTQASMHILSDSYYQNITYKVEELYCLREELFVKRIDQSKLNNAQLVDFLERAKNYTVSLDRDLPSGLCHLDYDTDNIIVKNNSLVAVLDFDDLAVAPYVVCLAYTLWHVRKYSGQQMATLYISEYEKYRPLSNEEKIAIKPIMLFRHYVISGIKILNGHISDQEIYDYLSLETELSS